MPAKARKPTCWPIAQRLYRKLSTGDALRKHVKQGTEIGKIAGAIMERGELVPDDVLFKILKEELSQIGGKDVVLLDGYPQADISQAETLGHAARHPAGQGGHPPRRAARGKLISRLSGRRVCSQCGATYHVTGKPGQKGGHLR